MGKINILSPHVYNKIAAGEVVERPFSVVKELVENSLDAGATEIEIYIENGGKQLVKVVDNGSGIEKDDLYTAMAPHATSKILHADDLYEISTLGFRGEALASIAAISEVEIVSVTEGNEAARIVCEGGIVTVKPEPAALEKGTVISVRNLFYNTPVRAKFLKTDKGEETDITNIISRFILGNPTISFKYYSDNKLVLQSDGGGLEEAVARIYGASTVQKCIKIDAFKNEMRIYGYIGNQNFFKPNRTYQSTFINGRYVNNNTINTAISQSYSHYLMKRQFAFFVLFFEMSHLLVDVNVHPNKSDVRFSNNQLVFGTIYKILVNVLDGSAMAMDFVVDPESKIDITSKRDLIDYRPPVQAPVETKSEPKDPNEKRAPVTLERYRVNPPTPEQAEYLKNNGYCLTPLVSTHDRLFIADDEMAHQPSDYIPIEKRTLDVPLSPATRRKIKSGKTFILGSTPQEEYRILYEMGLVKEPTPPAKQEEIDVKTYQYKGTLFNTYLMFEYGDDVYMVDQHAAHERILFDRYMRVIKEPNFHRQRMLSPFLILMNPDEAEFINNNSDILYYMGFTIAPYGPNSIRVDEVPLDLIGLDLKEFFFELLREFDSLKEITVEDVFKEKIAMTACKHAVKGGMRLNMQEVENLLKMMDGNMGMKCPHGRPICVKMTKREIEKMFKRIV